MKAQDLLPDDQNFVVANGLTLRKGSVGAFLVNARIIEDTNASAEARQEAEQDLVALIPALEALRLFDVFEVRSPTLRAEIDRHRAALSAAPTA